jgi:hypothetical protein
VCNILVQHDAVQDSAVLNLSTRHLLDTGVALDVYLLLAVTSIPRHGPYSLECQAAHEL